MWSGKDLAQHLSGHANSFNFVRLLAALSVVVSHSFLIVGGHAVEPLSRTGHYTLAQHAVNAFFVVSGLTLASSLDRNPNLLHFAIARVLRIFPALFAYGVIFAFLIGPIFTPLPLSTYLSDFRTLSYPVIVLLRFDDAQVAPGIFEGSPIGESLNEPLWTIPYELVAYCGLAAVFLTGILRSRLGTALTLSASFLTLMSMEGLVDHTSLTHTSFHHLARYGFCFGVGMAAFRIAPPTRLVVALLPTTALAAWLLTGTSQAAAGEIVLVANIVLVFGTLDFGMSTRWTRRHDISYGIYIYGWPLQQALVLATPGVSPEHLGLLSIVILVPIGYASWHLVEAPALRRKLAPARVGVALR